MSDRGKRLEKGKWKKKISTILLKMNHGGGTSGRATSFCQSGLGSYPKMGTWTFLVQSILAMHRPFLVTMSHRAESYLYIILSCFLISFTFVKIYLLYSSDLPRKGKKSYLWLNLAHIFYYSNKELRTLECFYNKVNFMWDKLGHFVNDRVVLETIGRV